MKLITRDTDYAVRVLCYFACAENRKRLINAAEFVRKLDIPRPFLRKIMQALNRRGLLKSYKGKGGGFMLIQSPEQILLIDVMKIFQGPLKLNECAFRKKVCKNAPVCILRKKVNALEKYLFSELGAFTIASLLKQR